VWRFNKPPERGMPSMNVLVIDVGGTHVKILATGEETPQEFDSGRAPTPKPENSSRKCHQNEPSHINLLTYDYTYQ
jgi:hypothetical protein